MILSESSEKQSRVSSPKLNVQKLEGALDRKKGTPNEGSREGWALVTAAQGLSWTPQNV